MADNEIIERRKLSDQVLDRLLDMIEEGEYQAGAQLPSERTLMSQFKVGRPAVREALQGLERMGLISISHGERARVEALRPERVFDQIAQPVRHLLSTSPATLEHLKEARLMFEVGMVRLAASKAQPADITRLREKLDQQVAEMGDPTPRAFVTADIAFHATIASIPGNPIFKAVSESILGWLFEFHTEALQSPGHEDVTISEHERIFQQIASRSADGAAQAMTDHLTRSSSLYRSPVRKPRSRR